MPIIIKNCGLSTAETIAAAVESGVDYLGFVFYPLSPRYVTPESAAQLTAALPARVKTVAVLVDPDDATLDKLLSVFQPDFLQLHGHESPARVQAIKIRAKCPIIKAIGVSNADDIATPDEYASVADMLLLDTKGPEKGLPGGTGSTFDWNILHGRNLPLPWFLAGGLTCENVAEALRITDARAVDVSSGLEIAPGEKDVELIREFNQAVKSVH